LLPSTPSLAEEHAASVNALDGHRLGQSPMIRLTDNGLLTPKGPRFGVDLAGRVEAVGSAVTQFRIGDEVFGGGVGAFAERVRFFIVKLNQKDLTFVAGLLQAGKVVPVIDRRYLLSETAEAIRYLEQGHARGKIVITV